MDVKNTNVEAVVEMNETTDKSKKKKVVIGVFCATVAMLLIAYGLIAMYYESHFLPNTTINGFDCSNYKVEEAAGLINNQIHNYKLKVMGRVNENGEIGLLGEIKAEDIKLIAVGTHSATEFILKEQNSLLWIESLVGKNYYHSLVQSVDCDVAFLEWSIENWDVFQRMVEPQDAYVSEYSEEDGGYIIIPELVGNYLDVQKATDYIKAAIFAQETELHLEDTDCYKQVSVAADDKVLKKKIDTINQWLSTKVTYDWNGMEVVVDRELIREWTTFENGEPKLDEQAVADFVAKMAEERDTYGKNRNFMTSLGVEKTLPSGAYGWKTDKEGETEALLQLIYEGSTTEREPIYISKGRQKGMNDIGSSYVEADLTNQHLYLYHKGNLVLETDFVSGIMTDPGCVTPYGVFGLTYKTTNAVLRGADYETPVFYWMPFHGNFGMHDATWRTEFGGDIYLTNGSHGCLNLPLDSAKTIYEYVSTGFPIICYY